MLKSKKIIIVLAIVALCAILAGVCLFLYQKNKIVYEIKDTLPEGNGKKASVILLGGQSNASGCSLDSYLKKNVSSERYAQYENGYDNVYINYLSGANMSNEFVKCATRQGELEGSFGPELGLAEGLHAEHPDRTFFIIKCAWGGTNLFEQWLSPSSDGKTGELYKKFVAFVTQSIEYLCDKGYDVQIEGMCWMQGESDCFLVESSDGYGENLYNFIEDIREELKDYRAPDGIAFIDAYIAENPAYWVYYSGVNWGKSEVATRSPLNVVVDTISAGLDCSKEPEGNPDIPHYDSLSQLKLGNLFAEALIPFLD